MGYNLKREDEVKEYITNLGIEYRFGCYSEKKPPVCHLLGDYLEAIKMDYQNSAKVYKNNCEDYGHPKSCLKYGNYVLLGKGNTSGKSAEALPYFERGCEQGDATACLHAGLLLTQNSGEVKAPKRDIPKGFNYLKKGCDNGMDEACYFLAGMHMSGVTRDAPNMNPRTNENTKQDYFIKPSMKEAFNYSMKACKLGNLYGCVNVSMMYKNGDGVEKNAELSKKFRKVAEDLQNAAELAKELKFQQGLD